MKKISSEQDKISEVIDGGLSKAKKTALLIAGIVVGFVNGMFGGGGGMIAVPALTAIAGLEEKKAHATAIAVILPLTIVSGIVYIIGGNIDVRVTALTTIGVVAGGIIGAVLLKKLSNNLLSLLFYGVMIVAGIRMVI